jgi:hypothetical protein
MKRILIFTMSGVLLVILAIGVSPAMAGKPTKTDGNDTVYVGNGYPSGPHYNLNILGKWSEGPDPFECPETLDEYNVIFVPREPLRQISILVESGKKGKIKGTEDPLVFEVTDWCTEDFEDPDGGNDAAAMRLPMDPLGFLVYARITGKPGLGKGDEFTGFTAFVGGCLEYAEDETGNDMILLGLVTNTGTFVPNCEDAPYGGQIQLERTSGLNGKGVKKAIPITDIFEFTGKVCYIDPLGIDKDFCCVDADDSQDGVYEHCDALDDVGVGDPAVCPATYSGEINGVSGIWDYITVYTTCTTYTDDWIFNIADFVGYMWDIDSTGAYNIKVRFYPCSEQPPGTCGE